MIAEEMIPIPGHQGDLIDIATPSQSQILENSKVEINTIEENGTEPQATQPSQVIEAAQKDPIITPLKTNNNAQHRNFKNLINQIGEIVTESAIYRKINDLIENYGKYTCIFDPMASIWAITEYFSTDNPVFGFLAIGFFTTSLLLRFFRLLKKKQVLDLTCSYLIISFLKSFFTLDTIDDTKSATIHSIYQSFPCFGLSIYRQMWDQKVTPAFLASALKSLFALSKDYPEAEELNFYKKPKKNEDFIRKTLRTLIVMWEISSTLLLTICLALLTRPYGIIILNVFTWISHLVLSKRGTILKKEGPEIAVAVMKFCFIAIMKVLCQSPPEGLTKKYFFCFKLAFQSILICAMIPGYRETTLSISNQCFIYYSLVGTLSWWVFSFSKFLSVLLEKGNAKAEKKQDLQPAKSPTSPTSQAILTTEREINPQDLEN